MICDCLRTAINQMHELVRIHHIFMSLELSYFCGITIELIISIYVHDLQTVGPKYLLYRIKMFVGIQISLLCQWQTR